jgi:hypothetical protein
MTMISMSDRLVCDPWAYDPKTIALNAGLSTSALRQRSLMPSIVIILVHRAV